MKLKSIGLGEQLASHLRTQIVTNSITAGTHLVEGELAARYGVSRGPVRDALRVLCSEGLVEARKRGSFVRGFTEDDLQELYEIRKAAETLACRLAIERADEAAWEHARHHLSRMSEMASLGEAHGYAQHDLAFHTEFYVNSGNARLLSLWRQFQPTFSTLLDITNAQDADLGPSLEDHRRLLKLAINGQVPEFLRVLEAHVEGSLRRMRSALNR